ncbi:MAG: protein kinase, partial [Planctomycetota bacterium]
MDGGLLTLTSGDLLLDRYRILNRFTGGMGILFTVVDTHGGHRYAVKTVKPVHRDNAEVLALFGQEARTWIALGRHESLVEALWFVERDEGPFLFLEFVEGSDLAEVLARGRLPLLRSLDLALQCAAGMTYAHS